MLFNSLDYLIFLPVVFTLYWLVKKEYRWLVILIASYYFYMCSGPVYGLLILGITSVTYVSARLINRSSGVKKRRLILSLTVAVCICILVYFKYMGFFGDIVNSVFSLTGIGHDLITLKIVLPVGISFYTFQTMSYVIDVYRGSVDAEKHFGKYAAFVSFFPQLVAGPIERSSNLLPQIKSSANFSYDQAISGVKLILWGYFKKLLIADFLSPFVQKVYDGPYIYEGFALVLATLFFSFQIYCDFSGYSDIAIGTARLFGIELMTNFRSPYLSKSVKEFWNRWHISLSTWFKDYIYIPLGGNRVSRPRHCLNLMITFIVSGLWHGANWTFVIWGFIHGLAQIIESLIHKDDNKGRSVPSVLRIAGVFVFTTFAWVFFVAHSLEDAIYVITHFLNGITSPVNYIVNGFTSIGLDNVYSVAVIITGLVLLTVYDRLSVREDIIKRTGHKNPVIQWIVCIIIGLLIVFISQKGVPAEFIYFQF
ncbi:MAG: MBOAT family protein [Clostridiales bacterium]|nr:MBOAT family protein [Clostridiales bacterium]